LQIPSVFNHIDFIDLRGKDIKKLANIIAELKNSCTFALAFLKKAHGQVLYGQLLVNPPGLDRSKGSRL
jgi:hypothetical protein